MDLLTVMFGLVYSRPAILNSDQVFCCYVLPFLFLRIWAARLRNPPEPLNVYKTLAQLPPSGVAPPRRLRPNGRLRPKGRLLQLFLQLLRHVMHHHPSQEKKLRVVPVQVAAEALLVIWRGTAHSEAPPTGHGCLDQAAQKLGASRSLLLTNLQGSTFIMVNIFASGGLCKSWPKSLPAGETELAKLLGGGAMVDFDNLDLPTNLLCGL